jgi:hypothetical protein
MEAGGFFDLAVSPDRRFTIYFLSLSCVYFFCFVLFFVWRRLPAVVDEGATQCCWLGESYVLLIEIDAILHSRSDLSFLETRKRHNNPGRDLWRTPFVSLYFSYR